MGGRRALRGGLPRLLGHHNSPEGRAYRRHAVALLEQLGIQPADQALLFQVGQVSALWGAFEAATRELSEARSRRANGRGRRPSAAQVDRLAHRMLTANAAYQSALAALREAASPWGSRR
jgi:hypothetical protein